ncbi:MAG: hypothetical protein JWP97_702 [Labilithrix sp.]|nr:hypothetical protein [Labilithrix sp.]
MTYALDREQLLDTLLNCLAVERYTRAPLLSTIVDELSLSDQLSDAYAAASAMLLRLTTGQLVESEYAREVEAVRKLVRATA